MNLTNLDTQGLKQLLKLIEQKESLQQDIAKIDADIARMAGKVAAPAESTKLAPARKARAKARRGRKAAKAVKAPKAAKAVKASTAAKAPSASPAPKQRAGRKRGRTGGRILAYLEAVGSKGATVKEIADALKIKSQNLYVWFNSTGKNNPGIVKAGPAKYILKA